MDSNLTVLIYDTSGAQIPDIDGSIAKARYIEYETFGVEPEREEGEKD